MATSFAGANYLDWPRVPLVTGNAGQDAMGVIASSPQFEHDFRLVVNDDILTEVSTGLTEGRRRPRRCANTRPKGTGTGHSTLS